MKGNILQKKKYKLNDSKNKQVWKILSGKKVACKHVVTQKYERKKNYQKIAGSEETEF